MPHVVRFHLRLGKAAQEEMASKRQLRWTNPLQKMIHIILHEGPRSTAFILRPLLRCYVLYRDGHSSKPICRDYGFNDYRLVKPGSYLNKTAMASC